MKRKMFVLVLLTVAATAFVAAQEVRPRPIDEATDHCASCNMVVHNDGYAVELLNPKEKALVFDSISEALGYAKDKKIHNPILFVQDAISKEWLEAPKASYAFSKAVKTPMNVGIHAFKTEGARDAFLKDKKDGKKVKFSDVASYFEHKPAMKMGHEKKEDHAEKGDADSPDQKSDDVHAKHHEDAGSDNTEHKMKM